MNTLLQITAANHTLSHFSAGAASRATSRARRTARHRAQEIAAAIVFLAGDVASFVHGAILPADGGRVAV
jgi:NAD(P)-dependent dehydrogenase (short-subunit alcohol dehydrogenase family)